MSRGRFIGPIGTLARTITGGAVVVIVVWGPDWWDGDGLSWAEAVAGLALLPAVIVMLQWLGSLYSNEPLRATSGIGPCLNMVVAGALFVFEPTRNAAALFYGASMLLAAGRGYAGCEVLAISNWLLGRDDQVGCLLFAPIDALEERRSKQHGLAAGGPTRWQR